MYSHAYMLHISCWSSSAPAKVIVFCSRISVITDTPRISPYWCAYGCQVSEANMSVKSHQSRDVRSCGVELRPRVARTPFVFMACMATLARAGFAPRNMPITMDTDYYYYYYYYYYGLAPEHRRCWHDLAVE